MGFLAIDLSKKIELVGIKCVYAYGYDDRLTKTHFTMLTEHDSCIVSSFDLLYTSAVPCLLVCSKAKLCHDCLLSARNSTVF